MSVVINIDNFQSWSEIFAEIERQLNLKVFKVIEPGTVPSNRDTRRRRSGSLTTDLERPERLRSSERETISCKNNKVQFQASFISTPCPQLGYNKFQSEKIDHERCEKQSLKRLASGPCPSVDTQHTPLQDSRLTASARKLSKEQMALLYEDILKPLDMYAIMRQRKEQMEVDN